MALETLRKNEILGYLHGGGAPPTTTGSNLRLYTVIGTAGAAGTEVASGGGYTAGTGVALSWAAASAGSQATNAVAAVSNYPRAETVVAIETWSTDGTPRRIEYGALTTSRTMAAGDTLSFASGAITSAIT